MRLFAVFAFLFSCTVESEPTKKQAKKQKPAINSVQNIKMYTENRIELDEVSSEQLYEILSLIGVEDLSPEEAEKAFAITNLLQSSCPQIWEQEGSLAQGLMLSQCREESKDIDLFQKILHDVRAEKEVQNVLASLALVGPYFKDHDQKEGIEVWIQSETKGFSSIIKRIVELDMPQITIYIYGDESMLPSNFTINLSSENRQKLTKWVAENGSIRQFNNMFVNENLGSFDSKQIREEANKLGVRSSPTWFVQGYRLRGLQSIRQLERFYQYP